MALRAELPKAFNHELPKFSSSLVISSFLLLVVMPSSFLLCVVLHLEYPLKLTQRLQMKSWSWLSGSLSCFARASPIPKSTTSDTSSRRRSWVAKATKRGKT